MDAMLDPRLRGKKGAARRLTVHQRDMPYQAPDTELPTTLRASMIVTGSSPAFTGMSGGMSSNGSGPVTYSNGYLYHNETSYTPGLVGTFTLPAGVTNIAIKVLQYKHNAANGGEQYVMLKKSVGELWWANYASIFTSSETASVNSDAKGGIRRTSASGGAYMYLDEYRSPLVPYSVEKSSCIHHVARVSDTKVKHRVLVNNEVRRPWVETDLVGETWGQLVSGVAQIQVVQGWYVQMHGFEVYAD